VREVLGLRRAPEFEAWLQKMQLADAHGTLLPAQAGNRLLAAAAEMGAA
jgi:ethanolamine ammonia-lyase large subunit